ncbi:hypothetical protein J5H75_27310 [Pseudomonas asiatica]|uniref:hypothetical protein n=1 Tax=Pseudomonas asiatica TaxID=2219225 RepID=UPI001AAEE1C3|nr:hypothetical protein [Pseudomonas asiatica]MBO2925381.1 hypothetical protein [Pseudomonas asiatica]
MNMQVKLPQTIDMAEVDDLRRPLREDYRNIDRDKLELITNTCIAALDKVDWKTYNEQRFGRKPVTIDNVIFLPSLPPVPKPFRSWPEVKVGLFSPLKELEYEPKTYKVDYVIHHTYQPDWVDKLNDRLFYDEKGVIASQHDAAKYRAVARDNGVHFIFILQSRNVPCPFAKERKDGTKMTHEQWIVKEKFDYCYLDEIEEFYSSARYKFLVENFGKGLPRLEETLRTNSKK